MKEPVYVTTSCLKNGRDLFSTLESYSEAGIRNIELGSTHSYVPDIEKKLVEFQNSNKAKFIVHNYFPPLKEGLIINLASGNTEIREKSIEQAKAAINICMSLGAKFYAVHGGFLLDPATGFKFNGNPRPYEEAYGIFVNSLAEIIKYAEDRGITLAVENNTPCAEATGFVGNYVMMQKAEEFEKLFSELKEFANFGMLLDVGHLNVAAGWYKFSREDFADALDDSIAGLHVHENDGKSDTHQKIKKDSWFMKKIVRKKAGKIPITMESTGLSIKEILDSKKLLEKYLK